MDAASMRRGAPWEYLGKVDWGDVAVWLFGFGIVAFLGLRGGGYDPLVHDQVGIAAWWLLLAAVLVGALPRRRTGALAWIALGLLAAFVAWTALSLIWTESIDRTYAELAQVCGYLGIFALALFVRGGKSARLMVGAVGTGIAFVAIVALLSRLHPSLFPEADQTARFLSGGRERLSYPLNYWNALGALIAIGVPLLLQVATCARSLPLRALAAAALPALALTAFLTLSRASIAAAVLAVLVFLAFTADRLPKALTALVAAGGGAILIAAAFARDAFQHGLLNDVAARQSDQMTVIVIVVCLAVGLIQAGISFALQRDMRPRWTYVSRRQTLVAGLLAVVLALALAGALGAPGRASDAWSEFRHGGGAGGGTGRLTSVAGESRYELWQTALDEHANEPLRGTGSGTFEFWWNRYGGPEVVRDAHSLYLQTLGELGIVGFLLLGSFLLVVLSGGALSALRAPPDMQSQLAAALAGCVAFCFAAAFDWIWQVPVLPVAMLLLASLLLAGGGSTVVRERGELRLSLRAAIAMLALAAIVAIAIPFVATGLLRQSEDDARAGDLPAALDAARSAENVQPGAATPRLQQALVLEEQGSLAAALRAVRGATEREPTNWRPWLVLARVEAERGGAAAAVRDYRKAKSLNPHFDLFER